MQSASRRTTSPPCWWGTTPPDLTDAQSVRPTGGANASRRSLLLTLLLACHASKPETGADPEVDTDTGAEADPTTVPLAGACAMDQAFGGFDIESNPYLTQAGGAVSNGVVPISILEEVGAGGDCLLLRRNNPHCDPSCGPSETCDFDGACIPYPVQQDVGTVTVAGLFEAVEMEASSPGFSYYDVDMPHPAYAPGSLLTLRAAGGAGEPWGLYGVGVLPLELASSDWLVDPHSDYTVAWNAPDTTVRSGVHLRFNIDQHGTTPVLLDCTFADTGQGTIPGSLLTAFTSFGVTGFPSTQIERRTVDSLALGGGCVDFEVKWGVVPTLDLEGYTPCAEDEDCPAEQTCNQTLEICE